MRYEKPMVMDLNARPAVGAGIEVCYPGSAAGGNGWEMCVGGGAPDWYFCMPGSNGHVACTPGTSPSESGMIVDCYSGTAAGDFCETGIGAGRSDPQGCLAGPSVTP